MKINCIIFAVFTLSTIVKSAWWIAAAQPIILSLGAGLAALNLDVQPLLDINWKKLIVFKNDKEDNDNKEVTEEVSAIGEKGEVKEEN